MVLLHKLIMIPLLNKDNMNAIGKKFEQMNKYPGVSLISMCLSWE